MSVTFDSKVRLLYQHVQRAWKERSVHADIKEAWKRDPLRSPEYVSITPAIKLGENLLFLPLFHNLKNNFPGARIFVKSLKGKGLFPAGSFEETRIDTDGKYGLEIEARFYSHGIKLNIQGEKVDISQFSKNPPDRPFYQAEHSFPWFLWGLNEEQPYSFPEMDFPEASRSINWRFGKQLKEQGRKKAALFLGSSDYSFIPINDPALAMIVSRSSPLVVRLWETDRFIKLSRLLFSFTNDNLTLFLTTGKTDEEKAVLKSVMSGLKSDHKKRVVAVADADLKELFQLYKNMDLVISTDTGPAHLAYISGARTLVLANDQIYSRGWYPSRQLMPNLDVMLSHEQGLTDISPEMVAERAGQIIKL